MPQFFGEFLIESGAIDAGHLQQALDLCDQVNLPIGKLAIREGWMDGSQVRSVLEAQRNVDEHFGEIAVRLGHLKEDQLNTLLHQRSTSHLYIGESLVRLGHLTRQELELQLDLYKSEVAAFVRHDQKPAELARLRIAQETLEALPRIASRMGRLQMLSRWGPEWVDDPRLDQRRWVEIEGKENLVIGIAASKELAQQIASAMLFTDPGLLSRDDLGDALGEFLNLVVGSATKGIGADGSPFQLSAPLEDGFPGDGFGLLLLTTRGPGCLVLRPAAPRT